MSKPLSARTSGADLDRARLGQPLQVELRASLVLEPARGRVGLGVAPADLVPPRRLGQVAAHRPHDDRAERADHQQPPPASMSTWWPATNFAPTNAASGTPKKPSVYAAAM